MEEAFRTQLLARRERLVASREAQMAQINATVGRIAEIDDLLAPPAENAPPAEPKALRAAKK